MSTIGVFQCTMSSLKKTHHRRDLSTTHRTADSPCPLSFGQKVPILPSAELLGVYIQDNLHIHFKLIITIARHELHILKVLKRQGLSLDLAAWSVLCFDCKQNNVYYFCMVGFFTSKSCLANKRSS